MRALALGNVRRDLIGGGNGGRRVLQAAWRVHGWHSFGAAC
jgi:hypothetical protein